MAGAVFTTRLYLENTWTRHARVVGSFMCVASFDGGADLLPESSPELSRISRTPKSPQVRE